MKPDVTILDCTLRDGSYAVDQQFTAADTASICAGLEAGGVGMIEIGHGVGLGASGPSFGVAAATDEQYIAAAAEALHGSRFGAFCIPGIASRDHLAMARDGGMHFVRIGSNPHQHAEARDLIAYARELGFEVSYNAMKSYLVAPEDLLAIMRDVVAWGAEAIFVVDSAGCLVPREVKAYVVPLVDELAVPVGFHGHNNLMLANANCLAAWEAGARIFDGTLQGIGRSGGNAQTETLAVAFEKMNVATGLDVRWLLDVGEQEVRPLMQGESGGVTSLNAVIGMAGFHSSYLRRVRAAAERAGVDLKDLILAVSERDRVDPSPALIEEVAAELTVRAGGRQTPPLAAKA